MRYRASRYLSASIDALLRFALLERESDFARGQSVMALVMTAAAAVEPISLADANGQTMAYVYGLDDLRDAQIAKALTRDEARRIASNIAKLPSLLTK
jgi:hypothetical protein